MDLTAISAEYEKAIREATLEWQQKIAEAVRRMQLRLSGVDPDATQPEQAAQTYQNNTETYNSNDVPLPPLLR